MLTAGQAFIEFWLVFFHALPVLLPLWLGAYLFSLLVLVFTFQWLKPRLKPGLVRLDDKVRARALRWRYRDPVQAKRERVALTWFFRFWTNFASAPALSCFAILLPMVAIAKMATQVQPGMIISGVPEFAFFRVGANTYIAPTLYFLPGLSYFGAMLLSFAKKRVFKRVRPPRPAGAFGHKMKDGSFPSGHSLTAICFWVMLGVVIGQSFGAGVGLAFLPMALLIVACTGLSRIYMGVHYPSDVLGGYVIGLFWLVISYIALYPAL